MAEGSIGNMMSLVGAGFTPAGAPVKSAATTILQFSIFPFQFSMQAKPEAGHYEAAFKATTNEVIHLIQKMHNAWPGPEPGPEPPNPLLIIKVNKDGEVGLFIPTPIRYHPHVPRHRYNAL